MQDQDEEGFSKSSYHAERLGEMVKLFGLLLIPIIALDQGYFGHSGLSDFLALLMVLAGGYLTIRGVYHATMWIYLKLKN